MKAEVTIEDSQASRLKQIADASHISFVQAVERAISAGIPQLQAAVGSEESRQQRLDAANAELRKVDEEMEIERYRRGGG